MQDIDKNSFKLPEQGAEYKLLHPVCVTGAFLQVNSVELEQAIHAVVFEDLGFSCDKDKLLVSLWLDYNNKNIMVILKWLPVGYRSSSSTHPQFMQFTISAVIKLDFK